MLEMGSHLWLTSILIVTQNFNLSRGIVVEKWIEQKQDHFDCDNGISWLMRYYENDEFYQQSGSVFIAIGGEYAITPDLIEDSTSFIYRLAKAHEAMMYSIEHRYYGKSHPVPDTSSENLRYLSVSQVLADIALFIELKKRELNNRNAFVMVFGASYAGNLAAWLRVEYPNLVQSALASSAPIYVKADFFEYYDFVENSIRQYDENCAINIEEAFSAVEQLLKSPNINSITLQNDFKMCSTHHFSQPSEIPLLILILAEFFAHAVSYNNIEINGRTAIENTCMFMRKNENMPSHYRLAEMFRRKFLENDLCIHLTYRDVIQSYIQTSWDSMRVKDRVWLYQTCTELGYHRTFLSPESIFGRLVPQEYFDDLCGDVFPVVYSPDNLHHSIRRINRSYNSKLSTTSNIVFTNGDSDPWRSLSVLYNVNANSPAIVINGASHCGFLDENKATKPNGFTVARCQVYFMICEWRNTYENFRGLYPT